MCYALKLMNKVPVSVIPPILSLSWSFKILGVNLQCHCTFKVTFKVTMTVLCLICTGSSVASLSSLSNQFW